MTTVHGDYYENTGTQIGAQGPAAQASGNALTQQNLSAAFTDPELAAELTRVRIALVEAAVNSTDFEAVSGVQGAIEAIEGHQGDNSIMSSLKKAGRRALDVALELGTKVAVKAIEASMGQ